MCPGSRLFGAPPYACVVWARHHHQQQQQQWQRVTVSTRAALLAIVFMAIMYGDIHMHNGNQHNTDECVPEMIEENRDDRDLILGWTGWQRGRERE